MTGLPTAALLGRRQRRRLARSPAPSTTEFGNRSQTVLRALERINMFCASIEDLSTARDETRVVRIGCPDSWPRYKRAAIVEVITRLASRGARIMRAPGRAQHFGRLLPRGCPLGWCATLLWLVACAATSKDAAATAPTLFPRPLVELHRHPGSTSVKSWPVTFGVPFRPGALAADTPLGVVDSLGARVPAQVEPVATWPDGSVRWLRVSFVQSFASKLRYYLAVTAPATPMTDDIVITSSRGTVLTVGERLSAMGQGGKLLVYVLPEAWMIPDLPLDPPSARVRPATGRGHHVPFDFDRTRYRVLFTRPRSHDPDPRGEAIVKRAYGREPIVVVRVNMRSGEITGIDTPPPHVRWGDISTPLF
jgi:PcRGLX-like N-terminal RIFT barrel domain